LVETGSEPAFATIYTRYHQRLYRYCRSVLRDSDDAYDALQSTLAGALAALQSAKRDAPLRPWLFRIAHNEAVSLIRRRVPVGEHSDAAHPCAASAEHQAGERARLALLVADLQQLTERERSVLLMHELSGLTHQEIAIALRISIHQVKHAISEARRSLVEFEDGRVMACEAVRKSISYEEVRGLRHGRVRAHLRDCTACAAFTAAIPARRADLQALAPPLSPILAAGLLARLHAVGSASSAGGVGGAAAGVAGKTIGTTLVAKTLVGVAIVATAAATATATGALAAVTRGTAHPLVAQAAHTARAAGATRRPGLVIGADSARSPHVAPDAGELGGQPANEIGGEPSASTPTAAGGSDGTRAASDGTRTGKPRPVGDLGSPTKTGVDPQNGGYGAGGGGGAGGGRHAGGPRGISATGEQHRAGRSERSRAAANGGGAAGRPATGAQHAGGPRESSGAVGSGGGAAGNRGAAEHPHDSGGTPAAKGGGARAPVTGIPPVIGLPPETVLPTPVTGAPPAPVAGPASSSDAGGASGQPTDTQSVVGPD